MSIRDVIFPSIVQVPISGVYAPAQSLNRVVFPEPLSPTSPTLSPSLRLRLILFKADTTNLFFSKAFFY